MKKKRVREMKKESERNRKKEGQIPQTLFFKCMHYHQVMRCEEEIYSPLEICSNYMYPSQPMEF